MPGGTRRSYILLKPGDLFIKDLLLPLGIKEKQSSKNTYNLLYALA